MSRIPYVVIAVLVTFLCGLLNAQEFRMDTFTYKTVDGLDIKADVYRPNGKSASAKGRPVVVWIHGGALIMGHREGLIPQIRTDVLESGYLFASIDYRLAPETKLPEVVRDVQDAIAWVAERGPELFGADPNRIGVIGGSAGGYLTLTTGYRSKVRPKALVSLWGYGDLVGDWYSKPSPHARHHKQKPTREEAFRQVSGGPISDSRQRQGDGGVFYQFCRQQGIWPQSVSGWDPHQDASKFFPYMPVKNVGQEFPPTLLVHGTEDTDVPFQQSELMAAQFQRAGVRHQLISVDKAEHGLAGIDRQIIERTYAEAISFLKEHLK